MGSLKPQSSDKSWIVILYAGIAIIHLVGELCGFEMLSRVTKPLLLPFLMLYFIFEAYCYGMRDRRMISLMIGALLFSFLGDLLLMFVELTPNFFLIGLGAFLLAHIFYIWTFRLIQNVSVESRRYNFWAILLGSVYYLCLISLIFPHLGPAFRMPVIVYGQVITTMLVYSFSIKQFFPSPFDKLLIIGTCLFVVSDSLLAVNKFYAEIPLAGFFIMCTYISAQFLIVYSIAEYMKRG